MLESDAAPAVFAQWLHAPTGAPTMLLYAHADVQPATPGLPWRRHPFEPWVEDGAMFGRGAQASSTKSCECLQQKKRKNFSCSSAASAALSHGHGGRGK